MKELERTLDYLRRNGTMNTLYAAGQHLLDAGRDLVYDRKRPEEQTTSGELDRQRVEGRQFGIGISVLVPVFHPKERLIREMTQSVLAQSYESWEMILADGSAEPSDVVRKITEKDPRIRYVRAKAGGGISENTNSALNASKGDMVTFLDQDDLLEKDALYRIAWAAANGAQIVYTDEDKLDDASGRYLSVNRKPEYNADLLYANNYICHLFAVKRGVALGVGGFRSRYDGSQDHDFILRCCDAVQETKIFHIPKVLYHWRIHSSSTAGDPSAKLYAYENGRKAVEDHLRKKGIACRVEHTKHRGFFRVVYTEKIQEGSYRVLIDGDLIPLTENAEAVLASYLARKDVGAVGARVTDRLGRILCSGYERGEDGRIVSLFAGMNARLPGTMNRAGLVTEVAAVSKYACIIRKELADCAGEDPGKIDSWRMCREIRKRGYRILIDPEVVFVKK